MNYIGSKLRLSSWIKGEVKSAVGNDLSKMIFCDMFAGTGIVGRVFKEEVRSVIANDLEYYSYVLNKNYIENSQEIEDKEIYIDELERLPIVDTGFIYQNYCYGSGSERHYFSDYNGKKIDTIRVKIEQWYREMKIDDALYYFLLTSLLESADRVANTASVYGAFLKNLKKSAQKKLILKSAEFACCSSTNQVFNEDSNELIGKISGDILYLDPPYNQRQYGSNYHILNTISVYDDFVPRGKTGLRESAGSDYCRKNRVEKSFEELIANASFKYIFLSYNNEGLMSKATVEKIMKKYGRYSLSTTEYRRFRADRAKSRVYKADKTLEYLHILKKDI